MLALGARVPRRRAIALLPASAAGGCRGAAVVWRKRVSTPDDESHPGFTLEREDPFYFEERSVVHQK